MRTPQPTVEVRRDRPSTVILAADTDGHRSILVRDAAGGPAFRRPNLMGATGG